MLRVLFDFVVDTWSDPLGAGISDSRPFDRLRAGSSQETRRNGHLTVLVMPARSNALGHPPASVIMVPTETKSGPAPRTN